MSLPTFHAWLQALPPVVMCSMALMWLIHFTRTLTGYVSVSNFAMISTLDNFAEAYRLITGAFLHADGLHIMLNTLAFARTGFKLEKDLGSVIYFALQFWCVFASSLLYLLLMTFFRGVDENNKAWTYQSTVGFSACLFALFVVEVETAPEEGQPLMVFGRFAIPRRAVPWFMIFAIQLLIPNVSFVGHVSGALVGLALSRGLGLWLLPSQSLAFRIDSSIGGCITWILGRYSLVYSSTATNPFEISAAKRLNCCSIPVGPLLPLTASDPNPPVPPQPAGSAFPTSGGRRLGSS